MLNIYIVGKEPEFFRVVLDTTMATLGYKHIPFFHVRDGIRNLVSVVFNVSIEDVIIGKGTIKVGSTRYGEFFKLSSEEGQLAAIKKFSPGSDPKKTLKAMVQNPDYAIALMYGWKLPESKSGEVDMSYCHIMSVVDSMIKLMFGNDINTRMAIGRVNTSLDRSEYPLCLIRGLKSKAEIKTVLKFDENAFIFLLGEEVVKPKENKIVYIDKKTIQDDSKLETLISGLSYVLDALSKKE